MAALPGDADLFWAVRGTVDTRSLVALVIPGEAAERLAARTDRAFGALGRDGVIPGLVMATKGNYPASGLRWRLRFSRDWKRVASSRRHWRKGLLEIAVPDSQTLFLGSTDLRPVLANYAAEQTPADLGIPQAALEELARSDLFVFLPRATSASAPMALPVRRVWLSGTAGDGNVTVGAWFELEEPEAVRLVALGIRTILLGILRDAGVRDLASRLRGISVDAGPEAVRVTGLVLTLEEIGGLVRSWMPVEAALAGTPASKQEQ
jgi:hypothetical protein